VVWGDRKVTFRRVTDAAAFPLDAPAVLVFAFHGDKTVLADIQGRGWCVPSGRIESGETAEEAARREAWEEAGIVLDRLAPFGATIEVKDEQPDRVLAVAFVGKVAQFTDFAPTVESHGRRLVTQPELSECYYLWDRLTEAVFGAAWGLR